MVTMKSSKTSYAERVIGAFSHLQREHRKHDIHVATLRAQIKRHAEARKDRLGPHWTHWVSKAITKLESEGLLEHTVPGTVALTSDGKKAIADARRSLQITSPQKGNEDLIWKQVTTSASRGVKRPRKSHASNRGAIDSDSEDDTASRAGNKTPRKRPRAPTVGSSPRKSMSRLTKSELQRELANVKKAYAVATRRPSSPLTDLSDEDDGRTAELKEKLKERDEAIENMRRELSLMRNGVSREENQAGGRFDTPGTTLDFDQMSSPFGVAATMSRLRATRMTRTQSGSHIPDFSKQPTPAPSERDDDYGQAENFGVENQDMAIDDHTEAPPASLGDSQLSVAAILKSEIQDLQKRVAANLVVISSKKTEISDLEKEISDHEFIISDRDGTIASLRGNVLELTSAANDLRESCRVAEETTANLTFQLQATEDLVTELRVEVDVSKTKLGDLEMSNVSLLRDRESMSVDLEQARADRIDTENAAEDVRKNAKAVYDELCSLKILQDEQNSKIEDLVDSLSRTSNDAQALRETCRMLEESVAGYEAKIQMRDENLQTLEFQVKQNDSRIAQLLADLQTAEKSVDDMRTQLAEANKRAVEADLVNEELKTELSLKDGAMQQYQNDLAAVQERFTDAQREAMERARERAGLSCIISDLREILATGNSDVERLTSRLQAVESERLSIQQDLAKKEADLLDTLNTERQVKLAFETDLKAYMSKNQELEEELGYFKTSKEADEATISSLRDSFMRLRDSQLQIFGDFEQEIISAQSSPMPQRKQNPAGVLPLST